MLAERAHKHYDRIVCIVCCSAGWIFRHVAATTQRNTPITKNVLPNNRLCQSQRAMVQAGKGRIRGGPGNDVGSRSGRREPRGGLWTSVMAADSKWAGPEHEFSKFMPIGRMPSSKSRPKKAHCVLYTESTINEVQRIIRGRLFFGDKPMKLNGLEEQKRFVFHLICDLC